MGKAEQLLLERGLRITPMRQLILEHLLKQNKALSLSKLEQAFPKSDRITIYRTLKTFSAKGLLHTIEQRNQETQYALCSLDCTPAQHYDRHPHFHCLKCDEIQCLEQVLLPTIPLPQGYEALETRVYIKGVCDVCQVA